MSSTYKTLCNVWNNVLKDLHELDLPVADRVRQDPSIHVLISTHMLIREVCILPKILEPSHGAYTWMKSLNKQLSAKFEANRSASVLLCVPHRVTSVLPRMSDYGAC